MSRICAIGVLLLTVSSCRLPPDRTPLQPLPEDGQIFSYEEIVSRARAQATAALEAFYVDNWPEIADAARGLEQSARFLPKTSEPPTRFADRLIAESVTLRKEAHRLAEAAKAKDVKLVLETLQHIHVKIRQLRPEAPPATSPKKDKT